MCVFQGVVVKGEGLVRGKRGRGREEEEEEKEKRATPQALNRKSFFSLVKPALHTHISASFTQAFWASESCADCHDMLWGAWKWEEKEEKRREERVTTMSLLCFFLSVEEEVNRDRGRKNHNSERSSLVPMASSAVSAANEALQANNASYFSSLSDLEVEKICTSADEDGR